MLDSSMQEDLRILNAKFDLPIPESVLANIAANQIEEITPAKGIKK